MRYSKEWVTNKLRELEEQNQHLREQNAHCNEQMELLRSRLEQLQELGATCKSRRESAAEVQPSARVMLLTAYNFGCCSLEFTLFFNFH